jgi:hypothetical protein
MILTFLDFVELGSSNYRWSKKCLEISFSGGKTRELTLFLQISILVALSNLKIIFQMGGTQSTSKVDQCGSSELAK